MTHTNLAFRRISITNNVCIRRIWARSPRTDSAPSRCSPPGPTSTTTTSGRWSRLRRGSRPQASRCTRCTLRSPMPSRTARRSTCSRLPRATPTAGKPPCARSRPPCTSLASIPFTFLVVHVGVPDAARPARNDNHRDAAIRSIEEILSGSGAAWRSRGARGDGQRLVHGCTSSSSSSIATSRAPSWASAWTWAMRTAGRCRRGHRNGVRVSLDDPPARQRGPK